MFHGNRFHKQKHKIMINNSQELNQPPIAIPHSIREPSWFRDLVFIASLLAIFYFFGLGSYPLFTPDEGRYSEIAREMIATGDYITPHLNGVVFLDKPILYYWL